MLKTLVKLPTIYWDNLTPVTALRVALPWDSEDTGNKAGAVVQT